MPRGSSIIRLLLCSAILLTVGVTGRPGALAAPGPRPAEPPDCEDDVDNDGDGFIDFGGGPNDEAHDPGCGELNDDTEDPFNEASIADEHERAVSIRRIYHVTDSGLRSVVIRGAIETLDDRTTCSSYADLRLDRYAGGEWVTQKYGSASEVDKNSDGRYPFVISTQDGGGRYRVEATPLIQASDEEDHYNVCLRAVAKTEDRHGGDPVTHERTLTFVGAEHERRKERRVLIVRGNLETDDGADGCSSDVPTKLQRLVGGTWTKINRGRTHERDADGDGDYRFKLTVGDLQGRYRLVAPRTVDQTTGDACLRAAETFRHRH